MRRVAGRILALAALLVVLLAGPAAADPPRPTDYRTEIRAVEPPVSGLVVEMIGGDSLLRLRAPTGRTVVVIGYKGERYLVFHPDGRVEEDHASYTYRTSRSRYGSDVGAEQGDTTDLRMVATDGTWAWHDHRSHLMTTAKPLGREPGDQVSEGVLPLLVDGEEVRVTLATFWVPAPSRLAPIAAAIAAGALTLALARTGRSWRVAAALVAAIGALVVGIGVVRDMPAHVGTRPVEWGLPAIAVVLAVAGLLDRRSTARRAAWGVLVALALLEWVWLRRAVLTKPVLPTVLPSALDRTATAGIAVLAVAVLAAAVRTAVAPPPPAGLAS